MAGIGHKHHAEVVSFFLGPLRAYLLSHPEHIQHALVDNARNYVKGGALWSPIRQLVGDGLATSDGDVWLRNRRLMQPLFSTARLVPLVESMTSTIADAVDRLEPIAAAGTRIDLAKEMMILTQDVLFRSIFGTSVHRDEANSLAAAILDAFKVLNLRMLFYFLPNEFPLPGQHTLYQAIQTIDNTMFRFIRERRGASQNDLLSILMNARDDATGTGMSERQLRDELVTMFLAGNETTSIAMTWLWYVLAENAEVYQRVRTEIATHIGRRTPTFADLSNLVYTKMVIQETMRLYPPGWLTSRTSVEDDNIGGRAVPAGSTILISFFVTQRDPALWERPTTFDPDRFAPERCVNRYRYAYLPFGAGSRQCIGMHFALIEIQLILVMMLQKYRIRRADIGSIEIRSAVTLRPRHGLLATLEAV